MKSYMRFTNFGLFFMALIVTACEPSSPPPQGSAFYYYPKPNIYYDIERKEYYAFDSAKLDWERGAKLSAIQMADLGKKVVIDTPAVPVYKDNPHHRLIYGIVLYTSPDAVRQQYIEDSLKSLPPKPRIVSDTVTEKPRKKHKTKIGKWLDKIFH